MNNLYSLEEEVEQANRFVNGLLAIYMEAADRDDQFAMSVLCYALIKAKDEHERLKGLLEGR